MDSLTATKDKLKNGQRKLEDMVNQLETETVNLSLSHCIKDLVPNYLWFDSSVTNILEILPP